MKSFLRFVIISFLLFFLQENGINRGKYIRRIEKNNEYSKRDKNPSQNEI